MNLQTLTVSIVEDLATDRELYRRALRQDSSCVYDILEAESVAAGLALCQTRSIDVVLLDYQLPDGDGLDFLERLAVQSNGSSPPVVMISGCGNEMTAVRAIKLGAEDYLVKSDLTTELLLATLRSAIENTRLRSQLKQCEARFETAIENMPDCFGIHSAIRDSAGQIVDFRFEYLNTAAMGSNRMTEADMGKTVCEVFPAFRQELLEQCARVVETGIPLVREDLVYTDVFGGEQLTIAYSIQLNKLDDGYVATWQDITAQKQSELSLQTANQQITTIWESMTDAYTTLDRDWRIVYTNSAATEIFRQTTALPSGEFLGKSHWEVFPASVGTIVEQEYRRAVADRVAVHFELFYEPTNTWFETHAYPSDKGLGIYFRDINQRKQTELARSQAEREIDRFFDVSIDLLIVANLDGYFVRINPACERVLGFTSAEMTAQPFLDFVHPDDIAATMAVFDSLSAGDLLVNFENRYRCRDESYRWILWSAILDLERNLIYASGRDITDRKREDEALRRSEELNRRILESHRDCVKVVDLEGRLLYMNDGGQRLMEIDDFTTVEGTQWVEFWQGDNAESAKAALAAAKSGEIGKFEGYCATFKDTPKWWEVVATPILDPNGNVEQILSVSRDVTDRKRSESILQAQQATIQQQLGEIESIYRAAPIGLSYISNDLKFVRINEQLAQINGLSIAEHIGLTIRDVLPEMADMLEPLYRQVIESGEPIFNLEVTGTNRAQPGVERHWLASYYPQTDLGDRVLGVNAMVQEITDRKRSEAARLSAEQERDRFFTRSIDLLAIGNFEGYLVRVNPAFERLLGYSETEFISQPLIDFVHPDDRASTIAATQGLADDRNVFDFECRCQRKDGSIVWVSWNATPYQQSNCWYSVGRDITLRKQTEIALQIGEELFRSTFENTSVGMAHLAVEGSWIRVNHKLCEILGYSSAELLATTYQALTAPADAEQDVAVVTRILNGEINESTLEKRYIHKQGHYVWTSLTVTLIRTIATDGLGTPQYWIAVIQDITERKQLEAQLRQRESQLQLFVKYVPVGLAMFDRQMCYLSASDIWRTEFNLPDGDLVGRSHYDIMPNVPAQWKEVHQRCLAGAIERCEEDPYPRKDGSIDWLRGEARPWYTDTDEIGGIIIFSETITDRKLQSAALLQSERKFSAIFNQTFQLMGLVSLDGVLLDVNQAALDSIAAPESEIVGKSFWDAPWWHTEQLQQQLRDAIANSASGQFVRYEVEFLNPSGGATITDFSLKPMLDEVGQVESIVAEAHDITERKQAQADLEERNKELDSFVFVVSHDLKAPLRAVANLSQWIEDDLDGQLTDDTQSQMNLLRSRVNRMSETIDGLLEYARCGRSEDKIESVALSRLLADVIDSLVPPTTFTIDLPTELPILVTKHSPLFQVFVNLVGNGIKHHPSEAGKIGIAIAERGDFYEFEIADDGSGIAPEHHDRMFKIFQAVNPQKRSDSTGIGLAIVKKIIEAEGGTIRLESELGRGTTFYFTWLKRSG